MSHGDSWTCPKCHVPPQYGRCPRCGLPALRADSGRVMREPPFRIPRTIVILFHSFAAFLIIAFNLFVSYFMTAMAVMDDPQDTTMVYIVGSMNGVAHLLCIGAWIRALWRKEQGALYWLAGFLPLTFAWTLMLAIMLLLFGLYLRK